MFNLELNDANDMMKPRAQPNAGVRHSGVGKRRASLAAEIAESRRRAAEFRGSTPFTRLYRPPRPRQFWLSDGSNSLAYGKPRGPKPNDLLQDLVLVVLLSDLAILTVRNRELHDGSATAATVPPFTPNPYHLYHLYGWQGRIWVMDGWRWCDDIFCRDW